MDFGLGGREEVETNILSWEGEEVGGGGREKES